LAGGIRIFLLFLFASISLATIASAQINEGSPDVLQDEAMPTLDVTYLEAAYSGLHSPRHAINIAIKEVYTLVASKMGYNLKLNLRPIKRVEEDFFSGKAAFAFAPEYQMEGIDNLYKTDPILCHSYSLISKRSDPINSIADLKDKKLGYILTKSIVKGYAEQIAESNGIVELVNMESDVEALKMLIHDRIDAALVPTVVYDLFLSLTEDPLVSNAVKEEFVVLRDLEWVSSRMYVHPNSIIYNRGEEFVEKVNALAAEGVFWEAFRYVIKYGPEACLK
jgi:hypothetical protein